jgi:ABC-type multidrug transport system fused ATPase/permease subunit
VAILAVVAGDTSLPWIVGLIIDSALGEGGGGGALIRWSGALAGVAILSALGHAGIKLLFTWWSSVSLLDLRKRLLEHLHRLGIGFFDEHHSGRLVSLFTNDAPLAANIYSPVAHDAVLHLLKLVTIFLIVSTTFGRMIWLVLLLMPIYVAFPWFFSKRIRSLSEWFQEARAEAGSSIQEAIEGVQEIKAFGQTGWSSARVDRNLREVVRRKMRGVAVQSISHVESAAYWTLMSLIYWWGGRRVLRGELTVGELVAFVAYAGMIGSPISRLVQLNSQAQSSLGAAKRVLAVLDRPPEESDDGRELGAGPVAVAFEGVSFSYREGAEPALRKVSFRAEPGEYVAIVGPSGAGKTTLLRLLLGFYRPDEGRILLAGRDHREYRLAGLRAATATVFQETFLFTGTIRENILFGRPDASEEEVREAATIANAAEFIELLPEGYDTEVGERGARLSVGQKQRISIARAALRDPALVLLDEATSALDAASERVVQEALDRLTGRRTCFAIAHRLSTVVHADRILLLDHGTLIDSGTHEELLSRSPLYVQLCRLQLDDVGAPDEVSDGVLSEGA